MIKYLQILLIFLGLSISFTSCKKTGVEKYSKDGLSLTLDNTNTSDIKWQKVFTSDFKRYEIYASNVEEIDITKPNKLIATISDVEVTNFNIANVILDSIGEGSKIYFKVAAVLVDRKIGSNVLQTISPILFSQANFTYLLSMPELNKIVMVDNNTFPNNVVMFDVKTLKSKVFSANILNQNNSISYGKNANGNYRIATISNNEIKIINIETENVDHTYVFGSPINSISLINGFILVNYYNSNINQYIVEVRKESDFSIVSNFSFSNGTINQILISSDNSTFVTSDNNGSFSTFSMSSSGLVTLKATSNFFINGTNSMAISSNGELLIAGSQGQLFNSNLNLLSSLNTNVTFSGYSFSQTLNTLAATNISNNVIDIFDATSFQKINTINFQNNNSTSQFFNPIPIYIDNTLFLAGTIFNSTAGSKLVILKK